MKKKCIILMLLILILSLALYLACDNSPVSSNEDEPETELISILRENWTKSSKPVGLSQANPRGKIIWYNPYAMIPTYLIWGRDVDAGESGTQTLWMEYNPSDSGIISGSWAGIMQPLKVAIDHEDSLQFLELRMYGNNGIVHIDLGQISEDINGNGKLDTEDKADPYSLIPNGIIDEGEDIGLDGLCDFEEPGYDEATNPDPNDDNWYYNGYGIPCPDCGSDPYDYRHINGTEGNAYDPWKYGRPDTEDIDGDLGLDNFNSYMSYKINLADGNFLVAGSNYNGWKTYRIPLNDSLLADTIVHSGANPFPLGTNLDYIRIWLESQNENSFKIGFASVDLLGFKDPSELGYVPKEYYVRDFQYAYGRIFDLGRGLYNYNDPSKYDFIPGDSILSIEVYKTAMIDYVVDPSAPEANLYVDLDDTTNYLNENDITNVSQIDPSVYVVHPKEHWILFNQANGGSTDGLLGCFMTVKRGNGVIDTVGSIIEEPYQLKLIRNNDPLPSFITWNYEWRNVYSLQNQINYLESLEIDILKGGIGTENSGENLDYQDGIRYIQILGLDRFENKTGANVPDGLVDIYTSIFDPYRGLLIFPDRKPFATDQEFLDGVVLDSQFPEIYTLSYADSDLIQASKYYIKVKYLVYDYLK